MEWFKKLEAATRFELVNNGFADRRLTTWLCRLSPQEPTRYTGVTHEKSRLSMCHGRIPGCFFFIIQNIFPEVQLLFDDPSTILLLISCRIGIKDFMISFFVP
jgi:hypothetical protein